MRIKVIGRRGSTYMQDIRSLLGNHNIAACHAGINWGLQGERLNQYYTSFPNIRRLPMLNHKQFGNKFDCVKAVQAAGVPAPESVRTGAEIRLEDHWIIKPYYSLGGRDIERLVEGMIIPDTHYLQKEVTNRRYEMRVHCAAWVDAAEWVFQKRVHDGGDDQLTWNHHTGGRFITVDNPTDPLHNRLRGSVKKIMKVLGYQFGAVDFIIQNPGTRGAPLNHLFIEFNLAPGWTLERMREWYHATFLKLQDMNVDDVNFMKEGAIFEDGELRLEEDDLEARDYIEDIAPEELIDVDEAPVVNTERMPITGWSPRRAARIERELHRIAGVHAGHYGEQRDAVPPYVPPTQVEERVAYEAAMEEAAVENRFCHMCGRGIHEDIFGALPRFCPGCGTQVRR
jgi:hypothetical protein